MARVTMAEVARLAGVNKGTVSRALRGDRRISQETRQRVWDAAKELGYELDAVASGLSSRRTGVISVAVERMDSPWAGEFLSAAAGVLLRCKMELLLMDAGGGEGFALNVMRRVGGRKADGLIWFGEQPLERGAPDIPTIRVGAERPGSKSELRVGLECGGVLDGVRSLAGGRPVVYRRGPDGLMGFLSRLEGDGGSGEPFIVWDGLRSFPAGERPSLVCGGEPLARLMGAHCLRVPVRELGVLSARVLMNVIRETGVRPSVTLVKTPFISPAGEVILGLPQASCRA